MNRFSIYFLISLMLCSVLGFGQKRKNQIKQEDTCKGKLTLAKEYYINGDFERSLVSLDDFQKCEKGKNSEYYKLKSEILIVQDNVHDAKICIAYYINSKFENYISDDDPELFKDLVNDVLDSLSEQTITSLSKKPENVDLATATIIVIKESEFKTRGYSDIIDLLSDQPGFDISRLFSVTYANAFQRGFRQENTERTLLMIDGIEENSVWSNVAFISRQYPLSNISSVEIIYGPASNMYGPRAFAGVINIITKSPKELINSKSKLRLRDNKLDMGITAKMLGGSYNSKGAELNVAGKNKSISFLLTGRFYQTDGRDLSNTAPYYNYDVNDLNNLVYNIDSLKRKEIISKDKLKKLGLIAGSQYYNYFVGYDSTKTNNTLTVNPDSVQSLLAKARKIDKENYTKKYNGDNVEYSNNAFNYYFGGKVSIGNFEAGFRTWKNHDGINYYQDLYAAGSKNGANWTPINTTFYTKYSKQFKNISITNTSSYLVHGLDKSSDIVTFNSFYGWLKPKPNTTNLSIINLVKPNDLINTSKPGWQNKYYYYKARLFENEFKINYDYRKISILTGIDLRSSQLQGDYLTKTIFRNHNSSDYDNSSTAEDSGTVSNQNFGANQYNIIDLGAYTQINYKLIDTALFITAGIRENYNRIRSNSGLKWKIPPTPKIAVVYVYKKFIAKAIYSQGIQNPSQYTKYSTGPNRKANPDLIPERIKNFELIFQNRHGGLINWDVSNYISRISAAIGSKENNGITQNRNLGTYKIMGSQANVKFQPRGSDLTYYFNTSITIAKQTDEYGSMSFKKRAIIDIAPFKANFIVNYHKSIGNNDFNINLRTNYVGRKPVSDSTIIPQSMGLGNSKKVPAYLVSNMSVMYHTKSIDFLTIQFTVNNLFNNKYYSPGPRTADGNDYNNYNGYVPLIPQLNRNYLITLNFQL